MTPEAMIATLDATVPVALLPVRIETRFLNDATELRIRVYPDSLHVDTHEPPLTPAEIEAGQAYWNERWTAPSGHARVTDQWNELARRFGPRRALWIAHSLSPTNLDQIGTGADPLFPATPTRPAAWTRAAVAALLPAQWIATGIRGGREVFRKASLPVADVLTIGPDPNATDEPVGPDDLALDEEMRWIADYDTAVRSGMAITVMEADANGGLAAGFDRLMVVGMVREAEAEDAAGALAELLRGHVYTDGLAFVPPDTPTNNTEAARAGDADPRAADTRALDPTRPRNLGSDSAGMRFERALGLEPGILPLESVPNAESEERRTESLLFDVLWMSTFGYYLDQMLEPLIDDATIAQLRTFVRKHVQPGGPLPVLRTGKQPYGVLPIVASARFRSGSSGEFEGGIHDVLRKLRPFWESAAKTLPVLGETDDADTELLHLLQMAPMSSVARFRRVIGPELEPNTQGLDRHALAQQYYATLITRIALGWRQAPRIASFTADPRDHTLRVPWVQQDLPSDDAPLAPDYLTAIAQAVRSDTGRATLSARENAGTLLEALTANAALQELDAAASRVVVTHELAIGAMTAAPARMAFRAPETIRIDGPTPAPANPGTPGTVRVDAPRELSDLVLPATTGTASVGEWMATRIRGPASNVPEAIGDLVSFLASLDALAGRPVVEIDRALRGVLDCFSHRLDAWYTSIATARLDGMRAQTPSGVHVGAYGWVEELRPDATPDSLGYVHAPSLEHASAAAILRSGHLAHRDGEHQTMNIDLRSDRVRLALGLLEGVAQGQPLAALLGYRLERALRDRDPRLARFIAPLRRIAPLNSLAPSDSTEPAESIAARNVVDGVSLLEKRRAGEAAILDAIPVDGGERTAVAEELARLADTLDAVSDLMVAESVYQTTAGNTERARAALAVLDRQERPIEPQVIRTPRSGDSYAQRLFVILNEEAPPSSWARFDDARARAEPRLNAWIARQIGNPSAYQFTGRIVSDNKPSREVDATLRQLGLSPLSLVIAARRTGAGASSELEERIASVFVESLEDDDINPRVEIDGEPADTSSTKIGLAPLLVLLEWIGSLVAQRPADARDLVSPDIDVDAGVDVVELGTRANTAEADFDGALASLRAAVANRRPSVRTLRSTLDRAAAAGAKDAVPRAVMKADGTGAPPDDATVLSALLELGAEVIDRMQATRAELDQLDGAEAQASTSLDALTAHHIARMRTIFGSDFPVIPRFLAANSETLAASLADQAALLGGDALAAVTWLQRMALVRPETESLHRVLTATELLSGDSGAVNVHIAQIPHVEGQRWAALPQPPGSEQDRDLALALQAHAAIDFAAPLAAIVCDDWTETIPSSEAMTGLSFHYDAPGARAPNTILLAVPADLQSTAWNLDELLDVVGEAATLAKLRMVGPRQLDALGVLLPTTYLPENFRHDVPSVDIGKLTRVASTSTFVMGKAMK